MGYATFKESGKAITKGEDIGDGQIELRHLSPAVYSELRKLSSHTHSGVGSQRINLRDLTGSFGRNGFLIYSSDATKRYRVTVDSGTGAFVLTEIT